MLKRKGVCGLVNIRRMGIVRNHLRSLPVPQTDVKPIEWGRQNTRNIIVVSKYSQSCLFLRVHREDLHGLIQSPPTLVFGYSF